MKKKEIIKKEVEVPVVSVPIVVSPKVSPITETFSSADMNTLRDKINELCLNS